MIVTSPDLPDQTSLFDNKDALAPAPVPPTSCSRAVQAATPRVEWQQLAGRLPAQLHLGTSSWSFPGWKDLVWDGDYSPSRLARNGLEAYARHPLLGTVSIDRSFYRSLTANEYAGYAAQVPPTFRFVVKAPALVADAQVRTEGGRGRGLNPAFLDIELARREFVEPALEGLHQHVGALVFQISPLPHTLRGRLPEVIERIGTLLAKLPRLQPVASDGVIALEVRDADFLTPKHAPLLVNMLRAAGRASGNTVTYGLGLHARMPSIEQQLPVLRALWPGPLVARWNLHRRHGAYGYEAAKQMYEPFNRLAEPDPETRETLARVIAGTCNAGHSAFVAINNKAEGSAPLSVAALAQAVAQRMSDQA